MTRSASRLTPPATVHGLALGDRFRVLESTYEVVELVPETDGVLVVCLEAPGMGRHRFEVSPSGYERRAGMLDRKVFCGICGAPAEACVLTTQKKGRR